MSEKELRRAELDVRRKTVDFDRAMRHLEETLEDTSKRVSRAIRSVQDTVNKPKRVWHDFVNRTKSATSHSRDVMNRYYRTARTRAAPVIDRARVQVRERPALVWGVFGGIAGLGILGYVFGKRYRNRRSEEIESSTAVPVVREYEEVVRVS